MSSRGAARAQPPPKEAQPRSTAPIPKKQQQNAAEQQAADVATEAPGPFLHLRLEPGDAATAADAASQAASGAAASARAAEAADVRAAASDRAALLLRSGLAAASRRVAELEAELDRVQKTAHEGAEAALRAAREAEAKAGELSERAAAALTVERERVEALSSPLVATWAATAARACGKRFDFCLFFELFKKLEQQE